MRDSLEKARETKARAAVVFSAFSTVVGVGLIPMGDGVGIKINLEEPPPEGVEIPTEVDGVPVKWEVVGKIYPH